MRILSRRSAVVPGSLIALLSFVFQACFQDDKVAGPETPASRPGSTASAWELHPALPGGEIREGHLDGVPITYQVVEGKSIWEGDIVLTEEQLSRQPAAKASSAGKSRLDSRWTHNIVPYVIAPDLPNPARVIDAMTHWQAKTNLRFVPRTNEGNLVTFASGNGCLSYLGMIGGNQTITLEDGCSTGSTIHAIGHAVGFHHEHRRATRDSNIVVNFDNIEAGMEHNFRTYVQQHWDGFDNFEFDFSSIMLYDSYAFSKNGLPTMTRRDGSTFTSQGNVLSEGDLALAAVMYPKVWQKRGRPGNTKARDIGVSFNGDAFAIGSDIIPGTNGGYGIYRWDGSSWTTFPGSGI
ncbi:MAG TPA: M12 family metallopeptidase, partial [Fibrobacteria bacterium]|nr:M12 family metallopeptidase [Fibrobacteria bacterium]